MTNKQPLARRILGKNSLAITLSGPTSGAAQIFNYDQMREVRMDLDKLQVTVLMTYDDSYFRVYNIDKNIVPKEQLTEAKGSVAKFYNDLITAAMKFTPEELENLRKQEEEVKKQIEEAKKKAEKAAEDKEESSAKKSTSSKSKKK